MAAKRNDLYSVMDGKLQARVPIRFHERGKRDEKGVWHKVDDIIVMMMSDVIMYQRQIDGIETGEWRKKLITPVSYIGCAGGDYAPKMSPNGDYAYSGTFSFADADGMEQWVMHAREKGDDEPYVHLLVREGWRPFPYRYKNNGEQSHLFSKYMPMIVGDYKKKKTIGTPWAFQLGTNAGALTTSDALDDEVLGRSRMDSLNLVGSGRVLFYGLFKVPENSKVLGQTKNGKMWMFVNEKGTGVLADEEKAEKMRPLFEAREKEQRERDTQARVAKIKKAREERQGKKAVVMDDQVVSAPLPEDKISAEDAAAALDAA